MDQDPTTAIRSGSPASLVTRAAELTPSTLNDEARTVEVVWSTGARVLRGFFDRYFEELSLDPKHVRMERLSSGRAPLLDSHQSGAAAHVIGVVESARLEKGRGIATVRFAKGDPAADAVWSKVQQGIIRSVSVGYKVDKMEKVAEGTNEIPVMRVVDWTPYEISAVPMGADAQAHFRAEEPNMEPQTPVVQIDPAAVAERERTTGILELVSRAKVGSDFATKLITGGVTLDKARALVLDHLATRDEQTQTRNHVTMEDVGGGDLERRVQLMSEALASRFGGPAPSDEARQYLRLRLVDMARALLEQRGISTGLMSAPTVLGRAMMTTSDFPALLQSTGNRFLRMGYDSYQGGMRTICRASTAPDFRAKSKLMLGEAPTLDQVNEHGEFKRGSLAESKETYSLATFGKIIGLTRQAMINDDLGAFSDLGARMGRAAAEFIAGQLVTLLTNNPTMSDGVALFHSSHANLGTAAVISTTSLGEALKMMRLQKGLDGKTPIDVTPKYLLVPAALEVVAKQNVKLFDPVTISTVNPFAGELEVVVDPRLDAKSATSWYLSADPGAIDTIEYSFLEGGPWGGPGPSLDLQRGWDVDGTEMKIVLDFGCGVIDFRGLLKNVGA